MNGSRAVPCPADAGAEALHPAQEWVRTFHTRSLSHAGAQSLLQAARALRRRLPGVLREQEFNCKDLDKAFACQWVDGEHVLIGTKCNQLLCLNISSQLQIKIPLPDRPGRPAILEAVSTPYKHCGMHCIAVSPDGQRIATGGHDPSDCQVFDVSETNNRGQAPSFTPGQTLMGHQDWLFGASWITEQHIATASRDKTIKLWDVGACQDAINLDPVESVEAHEGKVRALSFCHQTRQLASLSSDATVKIWDPHIQRSTEQVNLPLDKELVCMAMRSDLLAIGSNSHIMFLDPRLPRMLTRVVESLDGSQGVRSLCFQDELVSCGSGRGHLFFYDLRASAYMPLSHEIESKADAGPKPGQWHAPGTCEGRLRNGRLGSCERDCLQIGKGWLWTEDRIYREIFAHEMIYNACYAHAWDSTQTKLMCVGGPLAFGLTGCYIGLWH
ncbi:hypothetical protein WJX74_001605 [Apatococcus lobatus]|uniref:DDB1- and CUL4-associated factor 12 beta-propeller domain-containing protein n=1 Tax=Apatococcus lobatus TaxID=904363 RepID=A0AAW1RVF8_9CHLO